MCIPIIFERLVKITALGRTEGDRHLSFSLLFPLIASLFDREQSLRLPLPIFVSGDEPLERTVHRMLSDSRPKLRGAFKTADERAKELAKKIARETEVVERMETISNGLGPSRSKPLSSSVVAEEIEKDEENDRQAMKRPKVWPGHLVGGDPNHQPWMSTYAAPSHALSPLVKYGHLGPSSARVSSLALTPAQRAAKRREASLAAGPGRLSAARERRLDYVLGPGGKGALSETKEEKEREGWGEDEEEISRVGKDGDGEGGKLEVRLSAGDDMIGAGWGSLVEQRIEVCFDGLCDVEATLI